jgi:hypothetical protein
MRRLVGLAVLVAALIVCASAAASSGDVITDCNSHGQLSRGYSTNELRGALATLPADVKEYTNCYDVIQRALLSQAGNSGHRGSGTGSSSGSGGAFLPTPLIALLVLLALLGSGFALAAARRRRRADPAG